MFLDKIKLDNDALKFERLRLETFKNIERYSNMTSKLLRKARIKLTLFNIFVILSISLFSFLFIGIFDIVGIGNRISHIISLIILILSLVIPFEIWLYKIFYGNPIKDDDIIKEKEKSMEFIKKESTKLRRNSILHKLYMSLYNILKSLSKNIDNHDMLSTVITGMYTMFITTVFNVEKLPNNSFSTLEDYIERYTPEEYKKLYYESKLELKEISTNIKNKENSEKLSDEDVKKIERLGIIMTTDYILLKSIQYFCHNQCILAEELNNFLGVIGDEHKEAYKFFYETPINENEEINLNKIKL